MNQPAPTIGVYVVANDSRRFHLEQLAALGIEVVLLEESKAQSPWIDQVVKERVRVNRSDLEGSACKLCTANLDGLMSLSETGVFFCAQLAERLGLPTIASDQVVAGRDKAHMRRRFEQAGVPSTGFSVVASLGEARTVATELGFPVVLKPLLAGAKYWVRRVDSLSELEKVFAETLFGAVECVKTDPLSRLVHGPGYQLLVEKLIEGSTLFASELPYPVGEASVEGFVCDGEVVVVAMHDKPLAANGPFFEEVVWSTPSRLPVDYSQRVHSMTVKAIEALGLDRCMFHLEARTTTQGPVVLEVAARMGGGPIARSVLESRSVDLMAIAVALATGECPDRMLWDRPAARPVVTRAVYAEEGTIIAATGFDEVRAQPDVIEAVLYDTPGTFVQRAPQSLHCTAHVMVTGDDFQSVDKQAMEYADRLQFQVETSPIHKTRPSAP